MRKAATQQLFNSGLEGSSLAQLGGIHCKTPSPYNINTMQILQRSAVHKLYSNFSPAQRYF